ncbi:putative agmatinase 1 [Colletotrichum tropicale]|nr:putative agmatinase 1 [Colletotrichum tropicale]
MKDIEKGYTSLLRRPAYKKSTTTGTNPLKTIPRLLTLGGDHTILLPILRSIHIVYGPVSVIHFDSHLDSWNPTAGAPSDAAQITHGSFFYWANQEGLISNSSNMHAGLRTTLSGLGDYDEDDLCGFARIEAREIDDIGTRGIIKKIIEHVSTEKPVYLSIDIDTLDPAFAPATGTPETGGWSTRELRAIIRGLSAINSISADVVEVSPVYDTSAEVTSLAVADLIYEIMSIFVRKGSMTLADE